MRYPILPNRKRPFWSILKMNTVPNINVWQSISTKAYWAAISSPPQRLQGPVNQPFICMIFQAMMKNTERLTMWLRWHPDKAIVQHVNWPPPGSIWFRHVKRQRTRGKLIRISMIATPTQWKSGVHFGYRTYPTGGVDRKKRTQCTPIFPMWHTTFPLSYHMVSEWRPVFPLAAMLLAGGSQQLLASPNMKKSL